MTTRCAMLWYRHLATNSTRAPELVSDFLEMNYYRILNTADRPSAATRPMSLRLSKNRSRLMRAKRRCAVTSLVNTPVYLRVLVPRIFSLPVWRPGQRSGEETCAGAGFFSFDPGW